MYIGVLLSLGAMISVPVLEGEQELLEWLIVDGTLAEVELPYALHLYC